MKKLFTLVSMLAICLSATANAEVRKVTLSKDNTLRLDRPMFEETVAPIMKEAKALDSIVKSKDPIILVVNSPGGSIEEGLLLREFLSSLRRPVITLTMFGASMAFQTVQGLGERLVLPNGTLMSHKARGGFFGEFPGQLDSRYAYYLKRIQRMDKQAVKRTKGKHSLKSYATLIQNEFWCDGQECVEEGFADAVVSAECDKSLEGTHLENIQDIYMGHTIQIDLEFANCPLNPGLLSQTIYVDGQPLFTKPKATSIQTGQQAVPSTSPYNFDPLFSSYGSSNTTTTPTLDKETLFLINQKATSIIEKRVRRDAILY